MGTIDIHEPEVKEVKPASRPSAAVLSKSYPTLARSARVQGDVILSAIIDGNGQITNLQLVSGHPMLVPAAIAAVKQ